MIARVWKGWTRAEHADAYEKLLREVVYPGLRKLNPFVPIPRGLPRLLSLRRWSPEKNTGFRVKPGMTAER
jgi:hypothetical protein